MEIVIETTDGTKLTSSWLTNKIGVNITENCLTVKGNFWEIYSNILSQLRIYYYGCFKWRWVGMKKSV